MEPRGGHDGGPRGRPSRSDALYRRLVDWVDHPWAPVQVALIALMLSMPALTIGLAADDYDLALAVTQNPWSAYAFLSASPTERTQALLDARALGMAPWWVDLDLQQRFMRPLSSLSLALDFRMFPRTPMLMHLENAFLYAAIVLAVAALYRSLGLGRAHQGMATFFYAMHGAQSTTVGWIAGRATLLATLFGLLAVHFQVAYLRTGRLRGLLMCPVMLALSLASAEAGVAALAYLFALAWVDDAVPSARSGSVAPARCTRLWSLAGPALVTLLWQLVYRSGHYGVRHSGFYIDPANDPLRYVSNLLMAFPIYLASQFTAPFAAMAGSTPNGRLWVTLLSVAILVGARGLWLPVVRRLPGAQALALGALLAVIPLGASVPQDRLVSFVAFGVCALVATIVLERLAPGNERLPRAGARRLLRMHAIWAPLLFVPLLFGSMTTIAGGGANALSDALADDPRPVVLVNAPSHLSVHYHGAMRIWRGHPNVPIDLLYAGLAEATLVRTGARTLELSVERGYFATPFERIERDPGQAPLRAGDEVTLPRMQVHVLVARDGAPVRVRFAFTRPLRDLRFFVWRGRKPSELSAPAIGASLHVSAASAL